MSNGINAIRQQLIKAGTIRPDSLKRTDRGVNKLHGKASREAAIATRKAEMNQGKKHV